MLHLQAQLVMVGDWVFMAYFACIALLLCTSEVIFLPSTMYNSLVEGGQLWSGQIVRP